MRRILLALAGTLLLTCLALAWGVDYLVAPCPAEIGPAPADLASENVTITSLTRPVAGWFIAGKPKTGAVLLLHGVRSNRTSQIERMRLLKAEGYSVLAIDLQAHGESPGDAITFGHLESRDASAAAKWLKEKLPNERVGVVGSSLGGAAAILAGNQLAADVLVLEAVYADIKTATANRLRAYLGPAGAWFDRVVVTLASSRIGIYSDDLRPVDAIRRNITPKLFIYGSRDNRATPAEGEALFEAAEVPKESWLVEGARHVDFYNFAPDEYRKHVLPFLRHWLGSN